jgi:hypothetical protein
MLTHDVLQDLATAEPSRLVISVYARTDPRDPANTSTTPAWLIELRNGLGAIADRLERGDDRANRLTFRTLRGRIEQDFLDLPPAARARSVAWILDADGDADAARFSLQLPLRRNRVVADTKPFVSPLVDIADRGAPIGVILVGSDIVRLVQIEQGEPTEPEDSTFELARGDWRPFGGSAGGSPARGVLTTSHEEHYRARLEAQRDQLFETAASETAKRLEALGWQRVVLAMEKQVATRFLEALPTTITQRVIATADFNLVGEEPSAVADAVEPLIDDSWARQTTELIEHAYDRARAGGAATIEAQETLAALAEGRVHHLVLDPDHDFSDALETIPPSISGRPELLGERAVETAIATSASVSAFAIEQSPTLGTAGGMAALLRY